MREAADHEVVVDGALARDLERLGVHVHAGDRVRLHLVEPVDETELVGDAPTIRWGRLEAWQEGTKHGPFRPSAGMLAGLGPVPDLEDYEEASRLAAGEAGAALRSVE